MTTKQPQITPQTAVEVLNHEGLILMAYKDSKGIWTWGPGLTNASGHNVERYIDNPQTLEHTLGVYLWALRRYAQNVYDAFEGYQLTQAQFDAALSFHWNTGRIGDATWVKTVKNGGDRDAAYKQFLSWNKPKEIQARRADEAKLFFEGIYANTDGKVTQYTRLTKSYTPVWSSAKKVEMLSTFKRLLTVVQPSVPDQTPVAPEMDVIIDTPVVVEAPVVIDAIDVPAKPEYGFWQSLVNLVKRWFS